MIDFWILQTLGEFLPGKKKGWREEPSIFIICMGIQRERERLWRRNCGVCVENFSPKDVNT
jgi:hypothetical protein